MNRESTSMDSLDQGASDVGEFLVTYDEFSVDALAARVADVKASLAKDLSRYRAHAEGARMVNRLAEPDAA
jgi:hypothetical protein